MRLGEHALILVESSLELYMTINVQIFSSFMNGNYVKRALMVTI